jgi:zinc and cadmium transporter
MDQLLGIILLTTMGSVIALVGGVALLSVKKWSHAVASNSIPFAAGVLLTTSMIGLLPEATHLVGEQAYVIALLAFLAAYTFETLLFDLHHHEHTSHDEHTGSVVLVMIGDSIHNFIDGVAIATAYLINPGLGYVTAISTFLHEVPHEIGDFGIMLHAGYRKRSVFMMNFVSSLSSLLGALLVFFLIREEHFSGILLAISAGMFLYLGASDFLPKAGKMGAKFKTLLIFMIGIAIMYVTLTAIPHSHF